MIHWMWKKLIFREELTGWWWLFKCATTEAVGRSTTSGKTLRTPAGGEDKKMDQLKNLSQHILKIIIIMQVSSWWSLFSRCLQGLELLSGFEHYANVTLLTASVSSQNKSTDFTTFLNTPGCALGKHSNVKPINPEKITGNLNKEPEPVVVETRPPIQPEGEIRKCDPDLRWQSQRAEFHWTMHEKWWFSIPTCSSSAFLWHPYDPPGANSCSFVEASTKHFFCFITSIWQRKLNCIHFALFCFLWLQMIPNFCSRQSQLFPLLKLKMVRVQ